MNGLIIAGVLLISLGFGLWRKPWRNEFFLGGRQSGSVQVAGSLLATCLGGSAVFGIVGKASEIGWGAFWWLGSGAAGLFFLGLIWGRAMRRSPGNITLPQWLGETYGGPAKILAAVLIVIMWSGVIAAQLVAAGSLLESLVDWPSAFGVVLIAGITVIYTCAGGQSSVLRTDVLQAVIIILSLLAVLIFTAFQATGDEWQKVFAQMVSGGGDALGSHNSLLVHEWISLFVVVGGMYIVGPDLYSRIMSAKDNRSASRGAITAAAGLLVCAVVLTFLGVSASVSGSASVSSQHVLAWQIDQSLPGILAPVVQSALLVVLLSSADTCLLTASSVFKLDLFSFKYNEKRGIREENATRFFIILLGGAATVIAVSNPKIIGNIMMAYSFFAGGLLVPLGLLRFSIARSIPKGWVWLAMVAGGAAPLLGQLADWFPASDFMLRQAMAGMTGVIISAAICGVGWIMKR